MRYLRSALATMEPPDLRVSSLNGPQRISSMVFHRSWCQSILAVSRANQKLGTSSEPTISVYRLFANACSFLGKSKTSVAETNKETPARVKPL